MLGKQQFGPITNVWPRPDAPDDESYYEGFDPDDPAHVQKLTVSDIYDMPNISGIEPDLLDNDVAEALWERQDRDAGRR